MFFSSLRSQFLENENKIKNKTHLIETLKAVLRFFAQVHKIHIAMWVPDFTSEQFYSSEDLKKTSYI